MENRNGRRQVVGRKKQGSRRQAGKHQGKVEPNGGGAWHCHSGKINHHQSTRRNGEENVRGAKENR